MQLKTMGSDSVFDFILFHLPYEYIYRDTFKQMFTDLGAKALGLHLVYDLKGRALWINFHFAHRIDFKLLLAG